MSAQETVPNWKVAAYTALADYYKVEAERAAYEERLAAAKKACEAAGVTFRYGGPEVPHAVDEAVRCPCGAVVVLDFYARQRTAVDGIRHCGPCNDKAAELAKADAKLDGRDLEAEEAARAKPTKPPAPTTEEEISF